MSERSATRRWRAQSARHTGWLARVAGIVRRIIGAPDYPAYVAHLRAHHPERDLLSEDAFVAERLAARYETPGNRCC